MQVLPSQSDRQSERQLVSGKVGWGWRQATYPISLNFGLAGIVMLSGALSQLLVQASAAKSGDFELALLVNLNLPINGGLLLPLLLLGFGLLLGAVVTKNILAVCQQNSEYHFSRSQTVAIAFYWLLLIAGLLTLPNSSNISKYFVAIWWILPAAVFTGIALNLLWRSLYARSQAKRHRKLKLAEPVDIDALNIVAYSDQTVFASPSAWGQQPRQFSGLVLLVFSFFVWTMLEFSPNIRAIASMVMAIVGLTGFFTWQVQLRTFSKTLHLRFSGLWGMAAKYAIDLRPFSSLAISKLQEAGGELSWMQLTGSQHEITMPLTMTMTASDSHYEHGQALGKLSNRKSPNNSSKVNLVKSNSEIADHSSEQLTQNSTDQLTDQLGQVIRDQFHLAKQESERDSLGLANILLPQGAGILAGLAFMTIGCLVLFLFPLPKNMAVSTIAWLGVCMVSPAIARSLFVVIAPNTLPSDSESSDTDYTDSRHRIQPWEIGTALLLICVANSLPDGNVMTASSPNQLLLLLTLVTGWLGIGISICILSFVRRTPLYH